MPAATPGSLLKRVSLGAAMAFVAINVWTGGPILSLWVGSQLQVNGTPAMATVGIIVLVMGAVFLPVARAAPRGALPSRRPRHRSPRDGPGARTVAAQHARGARDLSGGAGPPHGARAAPRDHGARGGPRVRGLVHLLFSRRRSISARAGAPSASLCSSSTGRPYYHRRGRTIQGYANHRARSGRLHSRVARRPSRCGRRRAARPQHLRRGPGRAPVLGPRQDLGWVPLDTTVTLPPAGGTGLPLVVLIHGFGNSQVRVPRPCLDRLHRQRVCLGARRLRAS